MNGLPTISLPSAIVRGDLDSLKRSLSSISLRYIVSNFSLGISMPTTSRPGIGACILIVSALNAIAKSSCRLRILDTLTLGAGLNSKVVTRGPE